MDDFINLHDNSRSKSDIFINPFFNPSSSKKKERKRKLVVELEYEIA